jgi:hypothetical protein
MEALFSEAVKEFGLPIGLLIVAVVTLWRWGSTQNREREAAAERRLEEVMIERDLYRTKWLEALGAAEVGEEATKRLVRGKRRGS